MKTFQGGFRCRPPRSCKGWIVFFILVFNVPAIATGISCAFNESPQCINSNCSEHTCVKCLVCPPGQGLYPQCGTALKGNTTMACTPCKNGMYSDETDFGSCHPCHVCVGQETLQKCNASQNAICKKGCKDGFQLNIYQLCEKIPTTPGKESSSRTHKPTSSSSAAVLPTGIASTMNLTGNNDTGPIPTSIKPPTTPHKHNWITIKIFLYGLVTALLLVLLVVGILMRQKIIRFFCNLYCTCRGLSPVNQDSGETCEERELVEIVVVPLLDGEIDQNVSQQGESSDQGSTPRAQDPQVQDTEDIISRPSDREYHAISSTSVPQGQQGQSSDQGIKRGPNPQRCDVEEVKSGPSDLQTLHEDVISNPPEQQGEITEKAIARFDKPDLRRLLLRDLSLEFKRHISVKISKKFTQLNGWEEIGEVLKIPKHELEEIETRCQYAEGKVIPGELMLELLSGSMPDLTVRKFLDVLIAVNRKDVICYIYEEYFNK